MKIDDLVASVGKGRTGTTRARVLAYLEEHPDEIFRIRRSDTIADALAVPKRTVEHALWSLHRDGDISRARLGNETWYGAHTAIDSVISGNPPARRY